MRTMQKHCTNNECIAVKQARQVPHDMIGFEYGEDTPFGYTRDQLKIRCTLCGNERLETIPGVTKMKITFPYYNPAYDVKFESKSHQDSWLKSQGGEYI